MNCVGCADKKCRNMQVCEVAAFDKERLKTNYLLPKNQNILQSAALLVDDGRAGSLSRLDEILEFIKTAGYRKPGLAYCYGMEKDAQQLKAYFKEGGQNLRTVSCTVGGIAQDEINTGSCIHKVSCNPLGQAEQFNSDGTDFVIIMGICLGHDILLQKKLIADFTTFAVKDRVHNHAPLKALIHTKNEGNVN